MAIIKPISDLRNKSNEISELAHHSGEPIYITKNGEGNLVVLSIHEYRKLQLKLELFGKLSVAQAQFDAGNKGRKFQDVMKKPGKKSMKAKCEVRLLPQAEEDFLEIIHYIAEDKPSAAEKMADRFEKVFLLLSENPMAGRTIRDNKLKLLQYRILVVEPYLLFYQIKNKTVFVFRILHGARDYINIL